MSGLIVRIQIICLIQSNARTHLNMNEHISSSNPVSFYNKRMHVYLYNKHSMFSPPGTSESPVLLSIDEDWQFANDSQCKKNSSLSDLSDIVVLSTSPSKESAKTDAQLEARLKKDTINYVDNEFLPLSLKRNNTLQFTLTEDRLSADVDMEKEMKITEVGQEKIEDDEQLCDNISVGNKGINKEGLPQLSSNTKRDRRKKSKKKQVEIVCIEHNPSSFVDRLKVLADEPVSEEESSETYSIRQDRKVIIEDLDGEEIDGCQSKVSEAKQNKKCKKRKNKKVFESSQRIRENSEAINAVTESTENDKQSQNKLHNTISLDHSNRLKKSRGGNVNEADVRSEAWRTSRKNKSRQTETVEQAVLQDKAEDGDEIFNGNETFLNTEKSNARQKKGKSKKSKSDQEHLMPGKGNEIKENVMETDLQKENFVHNPGEELKALKEKYCIKSKTKRNKQQHSRNRTEGFCNLQNLFAKIDIEVRFFIRCPI